MNDATMFDSLFGTIVSIVPFALLLTMIALFFLRRKSSRPQQNRPAQQSIHPAAAPIISAETAPVAVAEPATEIADEVGESSEAINANIEAAVANGERTALAGLYLRLAAACARDGDGEGQMTALRSAAGYGSLHGPQSAHATARLALGEAAYQAGDLTSACEQWQLARTAFLEAGDEEHHARIDKRMRENGCPTDWVLTDF